MKGSIKTKLDELAYERDGYKCVDCGKDAGIEAHHIMDGIEELGNLVTLCHACHKKQHFMAGCFTQGYDARRNLEALKLGVPEGHIFRGNKYRNANGTLKSY